MDIFREFLLLEINEFEQMLILRLSFTNEMLKYEASPFSKLLKHCKFFGRAFHWQIGIMSLKIHNESKTDAKKRILPLPKE